MQTVKKIATLRRLRKEIKQSQAVGFVPTMGAFHAGHESLIKAARKECDVLVVSIFVNPLQFGPTEDYLNYPRSFTADQEMARRQGVNILFVPEAKEMYPAEPMTKILVAGLSDKLCGRFRPGHFIGVATVVAKLFHIIQPDIAYFGEKDWQQLVIIKKMVEELNFPVQIKSLPTVRDKDGLALSSRNKYLNKNERQAATVLYRALTQGKDLIKSGERNCQKIKEQLKAYIATEPLVKLQYLTICDPFSLEDLKRVAADNLIAVAAFVGSARLIDNIRVRI